VSRLHRIRSPAPDRRELSRRTCAHRLASLRRRPATRAEDSENLNVRADQELRADGTSARDSDSTAGQAQEPLVRWIYGAKALSLPGPALPTPYPEKRNQNSDEGKQYSKTNGGTPARKSDTC
jgi:hypothetical protein